MTTPQLNVVILTNSALGFETADLVSDLDCVATTTVLQAPPRRASSLRKRLRIVLRKHGLTGTLGIVLKKLLPRPDSTGDEAPSAADRRWDLVRVRQFEDDGLSVLDRLSPDVMLVDDAYILPASVFERSRLGTVNLHCGKLPDFKGAPPAFWELYEAVPEVGVTTHLVTADLDGGPILESRRFPLKLAPVEDPLEYADSVWRSVLRPAGIEMLGGAVERAAREGLLRGTEQTPDDGSTYRFPKHTDVKELRKRVKGRRARS